MAAKFDMRNVMSRRVRNDGQPRKSAIRSGQDILGWLTGMARWIILIIVIMVLISYGRMAYNIGYAIFSDASPAPDGQGEKVTVEITSAMTVNDIGELLEENGLLVDGSMFQYQERFSSYHGEIQPGTYTLTTDMTPTEILKAISSESDNADSTTSE